MKKQSRWVVWLLAALIFTLGVVACGPAQPPVETETEGETAAEATPAADSEAGATSEEASSDVFDAELPTPEPLVLDGAVVTDSGLQYVEKTAGDGDNPQNGDMVVMHFIGTLPDGTLFADTYSQGQPLTAIIGRNQLPGSGWDEGVQMMKVGGEAQMILPPDIAFSEQFQGIVPPDTPIILDVELVEIKIPPQPTAVSEGDLETTDSGLQFFDLETGDGAAAEEDGLVSTDYTLWVREEDGSDTFIASSEDRGGPLSFVLGKGDVVFPGWEEGVSTMQAGGTRQLIIPPELGLGEVGGGGSIPPNATLVLEITLVDAQEPVKQTEVDPDDYIETESGLKYYDIVEGDGPSPEEGQVVVVHYSGWLEDGTKFDSSIDRGQPFTFPLGTGSVIPGWDEGVADMQVGGVRQLVIPSDLGYGDAGSGLIPPGATLIFDIELLSIQQ